VTVTMWPCGTGCPSSCSKARPRLPAVSGRYALTWRYVPRAGRSIAATPEINVARLAAHIRPYRATSQWRRMAGSTAFRIAASVVLVIGLGTVVPRGLDRSAPDSASGRTNATPSEMALGTPLGDLDEEDLQALLSTLGELDAVTSTEADMVVLPALDRNGA
jgi:hypothetical protein